jgi:hypothetical protein
MSCVRQAGHKPAPQLDRQPENPGKGSKEEVAS